ncbi:MAG: peptidylprolyl isomerase [Proteobacteria bacterium]|nr:peptidylprolyl isomerase [Pseudomonadota bacterium]
MKIQDGSYVVFEFKLTLHDGEELDNEDANRSIAFVVGQGHMLPAVEKQIIGMEAGQSATIFLEPKEAFGEHDPNAIAEIPRSSFPENAELKPGTAFKAKGPEGPVSFVIIAVKEDIVEVDRNHPLAGKRLRCEIKIHEVSELTEEKKTEMTIKGI